MMPEKARWIVTDFDLQFMIDGSLIVLDEIVLKWNISYFVIFDALSLLFIVYFEFSCYINHQTRVKIGFPCILITWLKVKAEWINYVCSDQVVTWFNTFLPFAWLRSWLNSAPTDWGRDSSQCLLNPVVTQFMKVARKCLFIMFAWIEPWLRSTESIHENYELIHLVLFYSFFTLHLMQL